MIIFTIIQVLFHKYSFCSPVILYDITIFFPWFEILYFKLVLQCHFGLMTSLRPFSIQYCWYFKH